MTETLAPYEFEYAMSRLKDAIDYAFQTGEYEGARLWAMNVEESHKAEVKDMQETVKNLDEGAKLMHSLATGGEQSVLSRLDNGVDAVDAQRWQDESTTDSGKTITPDCSVNVSQYFNGYKATATKEWAKRHLNENVCNVCEKVSASLSTCTNCGVVE